MILFVCCHRWRASKNDRPQRSTCSNFTLRPPAKGIYVITTEIFFDSGTLKRLQDLKAYSNTSAPVRLLQLLANTEFNEFKWAHRASSELWKNSNLVYMRESLENDFPLKLSCFVGSLHWWLIQQQYWISLWIRQPAVLHQFPQLQWFSYQL